VPLWSSQSNSMAFFQHSSFICFHRNCKTAASLGTRLCLLRILRQVHNRQHSLEENAARLCWQFIKQRLDKRLCQFCSICLPQVSAAFHELHLGSIAASFQQRFQFIYRQPKSPLKLFIYIVCAEHFLLTSVRYRSPQRVLPKEWQGVDGRFQRSQRFCVFEHIGFLAIVDRRRRTRRMIQNRYH
jgi:hypothetical protein